MKDHTIHRSIVEGLVGKDSLSSAAKFLRCEHDGKTLFAGITKENLAEDNGDWSMSVGTLIWVPCKNFIWKRGMCGWKLEDLLTQGMDMEHWKEIK